ncbi:MAG: hypothetical protein HZA51_07660 [Planctomycetes bacterium]|nr:hypothetical protein [Planctomycetota bacterium]
MPTLKPPPRPDIEIRRAVHRYFYDRNKVGTSMRGKKGVSAKISVVQSELKTAHGLSRAEVTRAVAYLIDQGWVTTDEIHKTFTTNQGTAIPSSVLYYRISAAGVDKIEGEGEYTMPKFHGINISATGQNIITLGDNNQVDAKYESIANRLIEFKDVVRKASDVNDADKVSIIADIDTMESQLAKPEPNRTVLRAIWAGIEKVATATSLAANVAAIAPCLSPLLG